MAEQNGKNWAERWWPYALIAMLGGTGGAGVRDLLSPQRPDPFHGRDGDELNERHLAAIMALQKRLDRMELRQLNLWDRVHLLPPRDLLDRVTVMEEAIKDMDRNMKARRYPE